MRKWNIGSIKKISARIRHINEKRTEYAMTNEEKILQILEQLTVEMSGMKSEMTSIKSDMDGVKTEISTMKSDLADMKTTLTRVAVTQENVVLPKLQLLAEGHVTLQEQIKRLSVIDSMQDDISTLKTAVRYLSQELEKMKSAM